MTTIKPFLGSKIHIYIYLQQYVISLNMYKCFNELKDLMNTFRKTKNNNNGRFFSRNNKPSFFP